MSIGYVRVYSYTGGNFSLNTTLYGNASSTFGCTVVFSSGTQLFVGAYESDDSKPGMFRLLVTTAVALTYKYIIHMKQIT